MFLRPLSKLGILSKLGALANVGTITLLVYIAWVAWDNLGPRKPEAGAARKKVADEAAADIAETLRQNRGPTRDVALLHFAGDNTDYFTDALRDVVEKTGALELRDRSFMEKARNQLHLQHPVHASSEEAVAEARAAGGQAALFGELRSFESFPDGAVIDVDYQLISADGLVVYRGQHREEFGNVEIIPELVREGAQRIPWFKRGLAWLLTVLLLPVLTIGFMRTMIRKRSNRVNAFVLTIYTLANALMAYLLVGAALIGFWSVLVFLLALAVAFLYNLRIMTFAVHLEDE